ncbi:MerR family transcriptional regulator [Paenibacillus chartarius]|uniref:MerR family transcriptional regulator n=1 Tax=Paenibacillus chartarius TaxID=747481 RepID=A0ABV6DUP4_9BACL
MYTISEVARLTGITAFTLRYYEKIGILPNPVRRGEKRHGARFYSDQDLQFIRFIHGLKETGMSLEHIAAFAEDGCLLAPREEELDVRRTIEKRLSLLDLHTERLEREMERLAAVRAAAEEKRAFYTELLEKEMGSAGARSSVANHAAET